MSQENVELVIRLYEAFLTGDQSGRAGYMHRVKESRRRLPRWLNAEWLFYAAWLCGVVGFSGPDAVVAPGGGLLVLAAGPCRRPAR
jgi:hypothetical protein